MTLDQIEAIAEEQRNTGRYSHFSSAPKSLREAASRVGLPFIQCDKCRGNGYTKATLLDTPQEIYANAVANPRGMPHIAYDRCAKCDGAGGFVSDKSFRWGEK